LLSIREYKVQKKIGLKIAYIILVHSMDSVLAARPLLRAIWRKDFFYVIMVDKYTPGVYADQHTKSR